MARIAPASLLVCGQWNQASPALDDKILVINDCRYGSDASDRLYWPYTRNGQDVQGDDQGTVANLTSTGTKWGMAQMVDLSTVGNNRWVTRDFGGSFARPSDLRVMSIAMWIKPTYSGTPATSVAFGGPGGQSWSGGTYNAGTLYHDSADGKLKYIQYGSSHGSYIGITASTAAWNPTAGQWYYLEISFDYASGAQYLFIDGVLVGTSGYTGSISGTTRDYWIVGAANPGSFTPNPLVTSHYMQELTIYNGVWHTAGYTVVDRPMLEQMDTPYRLAYARDLAVGDEYKLAPLPRGNSIHTTVGIETSTQKFGGGCLEPIASPAFPTMRYAGSGLVSGAGNVGTIEFWIKTLSAPAYSDEQEVCHIRQWDPWSSDAVNEIEVYLQTNGNLHFKVNGSGNTIMDADVATNPFTPGTWHHVELNWTGYGNGFVPCSGGCRFMCFIDGVNTHDSTGSYWGNVRGTGATVLCLGDNIFAQRSYMNFMLDEFCVYDVVLHTSGFTPPTEQYDFDPPLDIDAVTYGFNDAGLVGFDGTRLRAGLQE